jgi:hypothetical protein
MRIFGTRERPDSAKLADVTGEIREFVRRQSDFHADGQPSANNPASLLQQAAGSSEQEIDLLIAELQTLRERLQSEGARVQQSIVDYAILNQSAMQSAKVISECVRDWRVSKLRSSWLR